MDATKAKRFVFSLTDITEPAAVPAGCKVNVLIQGPAAREGPQATAQPSLGCM